MQHFRANYFFLVLFSTLSYSHYWCTIDMTVNFSDNAPCPASQLEIFYLPDSLYYFSPICGKIVQDFNGHCDLTNTVTYMAKGYYQSVSKIEDHCTRESFGFQTPPTPIAKATCTVTLNPGPTADAGENHSVNLFAFDTLDGTKSEAVAGKPIQTYHWKTKFNELDNYNPGEVVMLDSTTANPRFIPIVEGNYRFYLAVEDEVGLSDWDTVYVHVCPAAGTCNVSVQKRQLKNIIVGKIQSGNQYVIQLSRIPESLVIMDLLGRSVPFLLKGKSLFIEIEDFSAIIVKAVYADQSWVEFFKLR